MYNDEKNQVSKYGCKACHYEDSNYKCKLNRCKYPIENHKCNHCVWGTWTGVSYKCSLPRCMSKLGNFNGVDNSVK